MARTFYLHQEKNAQNYYILTEAQACGAGLELSVECDANAVYAGSGWEWWFPFTDVNKISESTVYMTYRGKVDAGMTAHLQIRPMIRRASGALRAYPWGAGYHSESGNLTTSYATYTGANALLTEYTVVDRTDFFVFEVWVDVTAGGGLGKYAYIKVDESSLSVSSQSRINELEFNFEIPPYITFIKRIVG